MGYQYIALVGDNCRCSDEVALELESALHEMGLNSSFTSDQIRLFAAPDTPILPLSGGGIILGHLFAHDGRRLADATHLPEFSHYAHARQYILDQCWGDYLLIQPEADEPLELSVMRDPSPSCGLPCLYSLRRGSGFITSDVQFATRLGLYHARVDWDSIAHVMTYPFVKTSRTGLADISELLPGCALRIRGADAAIQQAWSPWEFVAPGRRHTRLDAAAVEIREAVMMVTRAWAKADRSLLLELSGGLDSSIVGTCLRNVPARVTCCTVKTPMPGADERRYASLIADTLNAELQIAELSLDSARFDFPSPPHAAMPRVGPLQFAVNEVMEAEGKRYGATAFFSGGGGDSVFSYLRTAAPAVDAFKERGARAGIAAIRDLSELHQCTKWTATRLTLRKLLRPPKSPCRMDTSFIMPGKAARSPERHPWHAAPDDAFPGDRERIFELAGNQLFRDNAPRGTNRYLRMPLLSQPVVEACLKAPSWMWIEGGRNRAVARAAFADHLPTEVLNRRSKGTYMDYLGAVYRKQKDAMQDFLLTGRLQAQGLLDANALYAYMQGDLPARNRSFTRVLDLCMVENWLRHQPS